MIHNFNKMILIEYENVEIRKDENVILKDVNFQLQR